MAEAAGVAGPARGAGCETLTTVCDCDGCASYAYSLQTGPKLSATMYRRASFMQLPPFLDCFTANLPPFWEEGQTLPQATASCLCELLLETHLVFGPSCWAQVGA